MITQTKIINSSLLLIVFSAFYFIFQSHNSNQKIQHLNKKYWKKYISTQLKISEHFNNHFQENLLVYSKLNSQTPLLEITDTKYIETEKRQYELCKTLLVIDSIYKVDTLGKNWNTNKYKIDKTFRKARKIYSFLTWEGIFSDSLDFYDLFVKDELNPQEWSSIILVNNKFKEYVRNRTSGLLMNISYYDVLGIPSKSVVKVGDSVSIDWVNFCSNTSLIPNISSRVSNYENNLTLRSYYKAGKIGEQDDETILIEEYQIPFSEISKDKKWQAKFMFINHNLEQDSVVLERDIHREIDF